MIPDGNRDPKAFALYISEVTVAFAEGKEIELQGCYENDAWRLLDGAPVWNWHNYRYRIRQVKKPSINWDEVHPDFNVLALDISEQGILSNVDLVVVGNSWLAKQPCKETVRVTYANSFASFKPGNCAWQDSLVMRPGWVTEIIKRASK